MTGDASGSRSLARRLRHAAEFAALRSVEIATSLVPRSAALWLGRRLGDAGWVFDHRRRTRVVASLQAAFPARDALWARATARRTYRTFGALLVDLLRVERLLHSPLDRTTVVEGREHLEAVWDDPAGFFLTSAHYGNWEWVALLHGLWNHPLHMVTRPLDNPALERHLAARRARTGNTIVHKRSAVRGMLEGLRAGRGVAIVVDQDFRREEAVWVDFFGRKAAMAPSLALLHLRTGAPILPVFCSLGDDGRYHVRYLPPLRRTDGAPASPEAIQAVSQQVATLMEQAIAAQPWQWLWMHDRWKQRPPSETTGGV